jgi:hypothetical protein
VDKDRAREMTPAVGKKKVPERRETEEKGNWNTPKDLCANSENCRDLSVKHNFTLIQNPNEEMYKTKVGEFFKLYNIALGPKFKKSKLISLHVKF